MASSYTVKQCARELNCHYNKVYELIHQGHLKAIYVGTKVLIPGWALEEFLHKGTGKYKAQER